MRVWDKIKHFALRLSPKDKIFPARFAGGRAAGVAVSEDTSMQVSAYYRGVTYISSQIAKLPWLVKNRKNEVLYEDPVFYLIDLAPNPEISAFHWKLSMIQNAIHHGNSYAEIERDMLGRPKALWQIPSRNVEPVRLEETGELAYKVVSSTATGDSKTSYLSPKNVFHLKNFHTKDGIVGQGVIAYAVQTLGISLGADQLAGNLFANGGLPSGVLTVPGALSDEAFVRIKESWTEAHTGKNSAKVAVLEEGTKFEPTAFEPEVMQFLESRKFGVLEIARFLGLPPTKLFDTSATTFSNQENSNLEVATDVLDAWAVALETEADIKLLNGRFSGKFTEIDLYAVFRGDMKSRADYFSKMMQVGSISPNEIRDKEGMAPYKDGDRYFIAVNNYSPADRIDEIIDSQVKDKDPVKGVDPGVESAKAFYEAAQKYLERK